MGSFTASVSSYCFYKPVFSSLVTSGCVKQDKESENERGCVSLGFNQVDCFNKNIFLNGEKYILDTSYKAKNNVNSISYDQIFGLEKKIKLSEEGSALKKAKAIAAGSEHKPSGRGRRKKKPRSKDLSNKDHIYSIIKESKYIEQKRVATESNHKKIKHDIKPKHGLSKTYESLPDTTLLRKKFLTSGHLCQDILKLKRLVRIFEKHTKNLFTTNSVSQCKLVDILASL